LVCMIKLTIILRTARRLSTVNMFYFVKMNCYLFPRECFIGLLLFFLFLRVISLYNCIALNFWMKGIEHSKVQINDYHLRYQLNESAKKYNVDKLNSLAKE